MDLLYLGCWEAHNEVVYSVAATFLSLDFLHILSLIIGYLFFLIFC